jgi:hypothetical protein
MTSNGNGTSSKAAAQSSSSGLSKGGGGHHHDLVTSPASFLNHHANRLKSKIASGSSAASGSLGGSSGLSTLVSNTSASLSQTSPILGGSKHAPAWTSHWNTQRNNLIILANASAIELYFLCIEDESDAEKLCTKCSEKFFLSMSLSDTILQAPLIASCIQVLARLALKYPNLAKISVRHLTDFLTEPSPILLKQYKHIVEKLTDKGSSAAGAPDLAGMAPRFNKYDYKSRTAQTGFNLSGYRSLDRQATFSTTRSDQNAPSYSKSTRIFEFIRDLTIECLCL